MRFMMLYKPDRQADSPPSPRELPAVPRLTQDMTSDDDVLPATEGLPRRSKRVRVRLSGKGFVVTDGPFTETKELIGG